MSDAIDQFRHSPPVSRTLAASVFLVSMLVICHAISPHRLVFEWAYILKPTPEIWRFFTSFLLTGGMSVIFIPYAIWNFGGSLERDSSRFDSASFVVYLLVVGSIILTLANYVFGAPVFTNMLVLAISWSYAQANRGQIVNFFFVNIPVMYLPYAMLFLTLIQGGPNAALAEATAIPAAHFYDFCTHYWPTYGGGFNLIPTPAFLTSYFHGQVGPKRTVQTKSHGTSIRTAEPANSAFTTGNSWGQRGQGRRLGSD